MDSRHALLKLYSPSNTSLALASQDPPLAKQAPNRTNSSQPRSTQSAFSTAQYGTLTCLPLPSESEVPSTEVLVILCTYQTHAISTLAKLCDRRSDPVRMALQSIKAGTADYYLVLRSCYILRRKFPALGTMVHDTTRKYPDTTSGQYNCSQSFRL